MQIKRMTISGSALVLPCFLIFSLDLIGQSGNQAIQVFSPVNVRPSDSATGYGSAAESFNSSTLNLNCSLSPITATLSSTADGTGYLLVDNNINLTLTIGAKSSGPTNVCVGGIDTSNVGPFENCFNQTYKTEASDGELTNQDPDNFTSAGGVPPIDISSSLVSGPLKLKIDFQDEGGYLANSSLYLKTNCVQTGVTGPALISGNPISSSNPTTDQLSQNFSFSSTFGQQIGFQYDLTQADSAQTLDISDQTIPQVGDQPLDPAIFQSKFVPGTSFATSSCLIHAGELLPNGLPACKVYTLNCKVGTDPDANGAQCPTSSLPNEIFQDEFDGPNFTLQDIPTPSGTTFHEGIGFLMAKEGWTGGPCVFDSSAHLTTLDCPQNLLTSFNSGEVTVSNITRLTGSHSLGAKAASGVSRSSQFNFRPSAVASSAPGSFTSTGRTTHPNSTFVTVAGVPEDLTTISVLNQQPGYWINTPTATVTLSSQPPNLQGTSIPGVNAFVASPIQSINYGVATVATLPNPDSAASVTPITNDQGCPSPSGPTGPAASVFNPGEQKIMGLAEGSYLLYYYALDCAGTEELKFSQDGNGYWSTGFYTFPINVDTTAPVISSDPNLAPAPTQGSYALGQPVTATYECADALSGIVQCGTHTFLTPSKDTATLKSSVDTTSTGTKTFQVQARDAAGNLSMASVQYSVTGSYDGQIKVIPLQTLIDYSHGVIVVVTVSPEDSSRRRAPKGIVKLQDGSDAFKTLATLPLQGNGTGNGVAFFYVTGLNAGSHLLVANYAGDAFDPAGLSAPADVTVQPSPVKLTVSCPNPTLMFGDSYICKIYTTPISAGSGTEITYQYDSGSPVTVPLTSGVGTISVSAPLVGQHTILISFPAQSNYKAANSASENFVVDPR